MSTATLFDQIKVALGGSQLDSDRIIHTKGDHIIEEYRKKKLQVKASVPYFLMCKLGTIIGIEALLLIAIALNSPVAVKWIGLAIHLFLTVLFVHWIFKAYADYLSEDLFQTRAIMFLSCLPFPLVSQLVVLILLYYSDEGAFRSHLKENYLVEDEFIFETKEQVESKETTGFTIVELMNQPDKEVRRRVILSLRNLKPYFTVPILKRSIQDSDEEVRIYAQHQLQVILDNYENQIDTLMKVIKKKGETVGRLSELATLYYEQAYNQLAADSQSEKALIVKALDCLDRAIDLGAFDAGIFFQKFKYALKAEQVSVATSCVDYVEASFVLKETAFPYYCELAYQKKDWKGLLNKFKEATPELLDDCNLKSFSKFWLRN